MTDFILDVTLLILLLFGYIIGILSAEFFLNPNKKTLKLYKKCFIPSQGAALLIALFMMTTERNQIPIIGCTVLIIASAYAGMIMHAGLCISPEERSLKDKKLLKKSYWVFSSVMVLTIM